MDNLWVAQSVELGCLASQWLQEHLRKGGYPAKVTRKAKIRDAHCLANTHKHAGRSPRLRYGRILTFERQSGGGGAALTVVFAMPGPDKVVERDALDLLNGCVHIWGEYLRSVGLDPLPVPAG
jgi:hypothetical protein